MRCSYSPTAAGRASSCSLRRDRAVGRDETPRGWRVQLAGAEWRRAEETQARPRGARPPARRCRHARRQVQAVVRARLTLSGKLHVIETFRVRRTGISVWCGACRRRTARPPISHRQARRAGGQARRRGGRARAKGQIIAGLQQRLFGKSSERVDPNQLDLDFDGALLGKPEPLPETGDARGTGGGRRKKKKAPPQEAALFPENLPSSSSRRMSPRRSRPTRGLERDWRGTPRRARRHPRLDVLASQDLQKVRSHRRPRSATSHGTDARAEPARHAVRAGLAAKIIVDKHCDHLPHYRQSKRLGRRHGIEIGPPRSTLWSCAAARHLAPSASPSATSWCGRATSRPTRRRSTTSAPATGRPSRATSGSTTRPNSNSHIQMAARPRPLRALVEVLGDGGRVGYCGRLRLRWLQRLPDLLAAPRRTSTSVPASPTSAGSSYESRGQCRPPRMRY